MLKINYMIYANIYATIFVLLIASTLSSYLFAVNDLRRWKIWYKVCIISGIMAVAMLLVGFIFVIWY